MSKTKTTRVFHTVTMDGKRIDATVVVAAIKNYIKRDFALSGLCSSISSEIGSDARAWVVRRAKGWKLYSGSPEFPVPHPTITDPAKAYQKQNNMVEGQYGRNRKALGRFLIKELENEIKAKKAQFVVANDKITAENAKLETPFGKVRLSTLKAALARMLTDRVEQSHGICGNLRDWYQGASAPLCNEYNAARQLTDKWMTESPDYSGRPSYPVKAGIAKKSPSSAYHDHDQKFSKRHANGRERLKMVQYLMNRVDEETNRLVNPR